MQSLQSIVAASTRFFFVINKGSVKPSVYLAMMKMKRVVSTALRLTINKVGGTYALFCKWCSFITASFNFQIICSSSKKKPTPVLETSCYTGHLLLECMPTLLPQTGRNEAFAIGAPFTMNFITIECHWIISCTLVHDTRLHALCSACLYLHVCNHPV